MGVGSLVLARISSCELQGLPRRVRTAPNRALQFRAVLPDLSSVETATADCLIIPSGKLFVFI